MFKAKRSLIALSLLSACTLASGCVPALVHNRAMEPNTDTPVQFPGAPEAAGAAKANLGSRNWKDVFTSPSLQSLIDQALKNNQELNIQIQELVIAQAEVQARRGEYMPKVGVGAGAGVDRVGKFTSQGTADEANGLSQNLGDFGFGLTGSWEVDIWGKLRNAAQAAQLRYLSSVEGRNFLVTQLVAEISNSYYDLIALDNKIDILKRNIALQTQALELVRLEKQAARVTELAVQRFEAEVAKNKSVLYDLEQERVQTENRINFLVGRFPQRVPRNPAELTASLPSMVGAGVPSQLLENRPDVKQAELSLSAAKLDVDVARKNFYPSLSIDARLGFKAFNPAHLLDIPESLVGGLAGNVAAPLINRAAIEAQYRTADAKQVQAIIQYERSILQAFTDVTNQLANITNMRNAYQLRAQQVSRLSNSVELSTILFKAARADYVEVLLTRRDLLESQLELIERRKLMQQSVVNLYQALGGGWRSGPVPPATSTAPAPAPVSASKAIKAASSHPKPKQP